MSADPEVCSTLVKRVAVVSTSHEATRNVLMGVIGAYEGDDPELTVARKLSGRGTRPARGRCTARPDRRRPLTCLPYAYPPDSQ